MVSRPAASSSSLTYDRVNRGLFSDLLLLCLTIRGAEEAAVRLWRDQEFMARLRLLDDPIKESRHVQSFFLACPTNSVITSNLLQGCDQKLWEPPPLMRPIQ